MTFAKHFCIAVLFLTPTLVGCGSDQGEQMATDQELSDYAQSQVAPEFKQAFQSVTEHQKEQKEEK